MPPTEPTSLISGDLSEHQVCDRSVAPRKISAERRDRIQADVRIVAPFLFAIDVGHLRAGNDATIRAENALKLKSHTIPQNCVCDFVTTVAVSILRLSKPVANLATRGCEECWNAQRKSVGTW